MAMQALAIILGVLVALLVLGVEDSIKNATENQGVNFYYPDTKPFQEAVMPLHEQVLAELPAIQGTYDLIQEYNAQFSSAAE